MDRRVFLALAGVSLATPWAARAAPAPVPLRRLNLVNAHTGETFDGPYRDDTGPIGVAMEDLSAFLRDHHSGEKIAHQSIERLASVLDIYKLDVGAYPTTDQGLQALITKPQGVTRWSGPYLKGDRVPEDPWGRPFQYRSPSQRPDHEFDLYSLGPGGQTGASTDAAAVIYNE